MMETMIWMTRKKRRNKMKMRMIKMWTWMMSGVPNLMRTLMRMKLISTDK
jgi:hypothetical protein